MTRKIFMTRDANSLVNLEDRKKFMNPEEFVYNLVKMLEVYTSSEY